MSVDRARRSASHLDSRFEFETLISDTSASIFAAPPDKLDAVVEGALERVREFFEADRCGLLSVDESGEVVNVRFASYAERISRVATDVNLAAMFPWSRRALLIDRTPVRICRLADLPPEEDAERAAWTALPIRAALMLPIETQGQVRHIIVLNTVREENDWPDEFVTRLRVLGELLVAALERQQMIKQLSEAELRVSLAADSAEAGLWTLDYRTGVFWVTDRARAIFGFSRDEPITIDRLRARVHPDDWKIIEDAVDGSRRAGQAVDIEYRIVLPSGSVRWIASRGRPLASSGEPERLTGLSIDVTDRRRILESLRATEDLMASGADLAGLGFYKVDYVEKIASRDARFLDLIGIPPGGRGLEDVERWLERIHPADRPYMLEAREQLHDGRIPQVSIEYRVLHPTEGVRWIQHLARVSARDTTGRVLATFGVVRDITNQKRVEEELRDLSRRLIRAHEEERSFLARELHDDVSQQLAVLAIDVGRAELPGGGGPTTELLQSVRGGLMRLSQDVHALAYRLHPALLEELGLAEALRAECERRGRQSGIELSLSIEPLSCAVGPDGALCLFRVAQEALNNIVRHAGARTANVTLRQLEGGIVLAVRDDGVGFDPASDTTPRRLGLASMRERVRLVNGTLDIESAPGQGTTVVAWVPVDTEAE